MNRDQRQLVKILMEISAERKWTLRRYSEDWIIEVNNRHKSVFIYGYKFPNNNAAVEHICDDKAGLYCVLKEHDVPALPHLFFESPVNNAYVNRDEKLAEQKELLRNWGTIVIKPNQGTGGNGVVRINSEKELEEGIDSVFKNTRACSVSPYRDVSHEYRLIVLNGEIKLIYEKIRPVVIGNGKESLHTLITSKYPQLKVDEVENMVPIDGQVIEVGWKHNLGQGASARIVDDLDIKRELSEIARKAIDVIGASFVSVDVIDSDCGYEVLEINSGVMMESFAKSSPENYKIAKSIYQAALEDTFTDNRKILTKKRFVLPTIDRLAEDEKIETLKDEEYGTFEILVSGDNHFVIQDYPFNINYSGSAKLCTNKGACSYFLKKMGFSVPRERCFIRCTDIRKTINEVSPWLKEPVRFLGFNYPMILKPTSLSQGTGVVRIDNYDEGIDAIYGTQQIQDDYFLLQEFVSGHDCRIVILDGEIIQAYERIPFSIVGDGKRTIQDLLEAKQQKFIDDDRDKAVDISDQRIIKNINRSGFKLDSVLKKGEEIRLQDICNLSLGGTARDIRDILSQSIKEVSVYVAKKLNLRLCGIDMMIEDFSSEKYTILEVNSAPGLDNYLCDDEELRELYRKILHVIQGGNTK